MSSKRTINVGKIGSCPAVKQSKQKILSRSAVETLLQAGLLALSVVIIEAIGVSMIYVPFTIFRSLLESSIIIVFIVIMSLFVANVLFAYIELSWFCRYTRGFRVVMLSFVETVFFFIVLIVTLSVLELGGMMIVRFDNPLVFVVVIFVLLVITNIYIPRLIIIK